MDDHAERRRRTLATLAVYVLPLLLVFVAVAGRAAWLVWVGVAYVWIICTWFALRKLRYLRQWEEYRRWQGGRCMGCEYDLTGNTSGVCPECGRRAPVPPGKVKRHG